MPTIVLTLTDAQLTQIRSALPVRLAADGPAFRMSTVAELSAWLMDKMRLEVEGREFGQAQETAIKQKRADLAAAGWGPPP